MQTDRHTLELLAPAKNADFGIAAIDHGADAVYIGGPAFGARAAAENTLGDIARLAQYAHRFHAKVFVALNTILHDEELEAARTLAWQVYEAGADALIVQDMGMLELDLPPIQLHASTQTDIRSAAKARFLQDVGFSQIVLARELSLAQIRKVAAETTCQLEYFVHGALCVAYSGQCYISHAHTGRSANRGECSQACRLPYDLTHADGTVVAQQQHMLSMKDNNQSDNLRALAEAGISSFKIEGRLKDLPYVKNITAHYRQLLDAILEDDPVWKRASSGRSTFLFTPQAEKTFNRGYTDYFANERQHGIEAFESPKFVGVLIGQVISVDQQQQRFFDIEPLEPLHNGDGLAYYTPKGELVGLRVNVSTALDSGKTRVSVAEPLPAALVAGTALFRNHDHAFERILEKHSAERRISIRLRFFATPDGYGLQAVDENSISATAYIKGAYEPARNTETARRMLCDALGKLGNSLFMASDIALDISPLPFIPTSVLNGLRRDVCEALETARAQAHSRPARAAPVEPPAPYPQDALSYLGNVLNSQAQAFYARHGVKLIEPAFEANEETGDVSVMITRHCLRYSFNLCPKEVKGIRPDPMVLVNGKEKLTLRFDCKRCEMHVISHLKPHIAHLHTTTIPQTIRFLPKQNKSGTLLHGKNAASQEYKL